VDGWVDRCEPFGLPGLEEHKRSGGREQASAAVRASILALTRTTSPTETGQSHWSSREMAVTSRSESPAWAGADRSSSSWAQPEPVPTSRSGYARRYRAIGCGFAYRVGK
jgi:hypothetical protein